MKKYKVKIKNPVLGVPITIVDRIADDGYIHFTHTGARERELKFKVINMSTMSGISANYWTLINGKPKYSRIYIQKISDIE